MKDLLILFGGCSNEHEVSLHSAATIIKACDKERYNIIKVGITKDGRWLMYSGAVQNISDGSWIEDKENQRPVSISLNPNERGIIVLDKDKNYRIISVDIAFPVLHGRNGEDGTIQGLLQLSGIPYIGCNTYSSAVCMNKSTAKILAKREGVESTPFLVIHEHEKENAVNLIKENNFKYPLFIKPQSGGSSVGISKVDDESNLDIALDIAFKNDCDKIALIEQGVRGKEIEVAILGSADKAVVSPCGEIEPGGEFYDYENKYHDDTARYFAPARIEKDLSQIVQNMALTVFKACGCEGLARCDFFVTDDGKVLFNEINTIPGFTQISMYGKLLSLLDISMSDVIDKLVVLAYARDKS